MRSFKPKIRHNFSNHDSREQLIAKLHARSGYTLAHLQAQTTKHLVHLRNRLPKNTGGGLQPLERVPVDRHAAKLTA